MHNIGSTVYFEKQEGEKSRGGGNLFFVLFHSFMTGELLKLAVHYLASEKREKNVRIIRS